MRKRIYWLLPDLGSARRTMDELLLARVTEHHIHFVAREGAAMDGLHPANVLQTSDLVEAAQAGALIGSGLGAAGGVAAAFAFDPGSPAALVIGIAAVGAMLGTWSSSMIGSSTPSRRLKRFERAVDDGQYLLIVDVPRTRVSQIEALLQRTHPEARFEGMEPNVPAFP
ncbi:MULTISPECIES: DUF1269 domain-containing protein [Roseateles]|uniref:DUF1269 domain-containing protein n=1 Tax=Pelomonas caseinilytica TaxID=2906763 RepID=A0ABS8XL19_9BURK|nr:MULTISPECIES: DUF1269 domain-containing protein [unclassified Roseateles]MCE4539279.1 DUF1269 domain-containing protein [Pelomonas sp. P7]HEV6964735.1 DUF1269 domain-containing protein [Roseateles sp.]